MATRCLKYQRKSLRQYGERSELHLPTVLPDRSLLIGQKLVENAKIQMIHFSDFQTMWASCINRSLQVFPHSKRLNERKLLIQVG